MDVHAPARPPAPPLPSEFPPLGGGRRKYGGPVDHRCRLAALVALACALPTAPAQAAATTVKASADSFVASDGPTKNFGTASKLNVKASPATNAYLRFVLPASTATVRGATLRVFATHDS